MNFTVLDMYFVFNIFIITLSLFMFFKTTPDLLKKKEYIYFKMFILTLCFYVVMNTLWTMQEYDVIELPKTLFTVICFLSYGSVIFTAYCFYAFTMTHFEFNTKDGIVDILGLAPFLAGLILLVISLFNGMVFSVSDTIHNVNGPLYILLPVSSFIYFIVITIMAIIKTIKAKTISSRKYAITLIISMAFLIFWVLLDVYFDRITIIPIAVFSVIFFMFISLQQSSIYTDALTQMFNRRKAVEFINDQKDTISEENPLYIFLFDIKYFKDINDTYGHSEGDEALIITAKAIKEVFSKHHGFSSRYGGDEFFCAWRNTNEDIEASIIADEVREIIRRKCLELNKPYDLTLSVGIISCTNSKKSFDSYFKEVDNSLYLDKRNYHSIGES